MQKQESIFSSYKELPLQLNIVAAAALANVNGRATRRWLPQAEHAKDLVVGCSVDGEVVCLAVAGV